MNHMNMMTQPEIAVGILTASEIHFRLNGRFKSAALSEACEGEGKMSVEQDSMVLQCGTKQMLCENKELVLAPEQYDSMSFDLLDVVIGIQFHWERKEDQRFKGKLRFFVADGQVTAVNVIPLEDYLLSVISSEMSATSSIELLKAHAVISRGWLIAQKNKEQELKTTSPYQTVYETADEYIRWFDREDHAQYDVCADDHCQRYQGITKVSTTYAQQAVEETRGQVLVYDGKICDTRFYKCCGGVTETFENVWEPVHHPYLTKVVDAASFPSGFDLDLTNETNATRWIQASPDAFCNTHDKQVLQQVLNDYDQETQDFYRWTVEFTQAGLSDLLRRRTGHDFGDILDLVPLERGVSSRIIRLKVIGTKKTLILGKELVIRKALSESHLYSSAFVVQKSGDNVLPQTFTLTGAGWGHGVGLCQIGAAVMGAKGYRYEAILSHYFPGATLEKQYE